MTILQLGILRIGVLSVILANGQLSASLLPPSILYQKDTYGIRKVPHSKSRFKAES